MTHFGLPADLTRALCWALLHFLWQGLALALILAAALAVVRRATARYALGVATLVLMLAAPVATILVLRQPATASLAGGENAGSWSEPVRQSAGSALSSRLEPGPAGPRSGRGSALPTGSDAWLLEFWLAGVLVFAARALGGFCMVERLRRQESRAASAELEAMGRALERKLGVRRVLRYCESRHLSAPAVLGWFRPVVLLPVAALTGLEPSQLRAVIAHELAHIRRLDAFVNLFQTCAETLLFYHPAVWWVSARIRAERENCCDDVAVSVCGGVPEYARALLLMEERARSANPRLALAATGSPLRARVLRLLGIERRAGGVRSLGLTAASLCLTLVLLAATGLFGTAGEYSAGTAHPLPSASLSSALVSPGADTASGASMATLAPAAPQTASTTPATAGANHSSSQESAGAQAGKESFIGGLNSLGLKNLSADQLIALKVQGVTLDYIRQIRSTGLNPALNELIAIKVQGVTPEYIRGMHSAGLQPTVDELIAMKVQQVTSGYISALKAAGFNPDVNQLIALKVQGVTPEYLSAMRAAGVNLTAEEAIAMKVQGVTPDYVRELHAEGIEPESHELIALKVEGVTPEYVGALRAAGVQPAVEDLIAMKVQGVTPDYVRDLHSAGLTPTTDQLIALRTQGVTADYVRALERAGLSKLSVNDYITAKVMGITPAFIEKARSHGLQNLTLDKLIALKQAGVF